MLNKIIRKIIPKQIKGYSLGIHLSVIALSIFGLIMVMSANVGIETTTEDLLPVFIKELAFMVVSYILMLHASRHFRLAWVKKYAIPIIVVTIIMLLIPLGFKNVGGAYAWIRFKGITIQPSEFAKVVMILIFAVYLGDRHYQKSTTWYELAGVPLLFLGASIFIIMFLQNDLGSAAVMLLMIFFVAMVPTNKALNRLQLFGMIAVVLGVVGVVFVSSSGGVKILESLGLPPYMLKRFLTVSDPFHDKVDSGYHVFNGFVSFVNGGFFGKGLGLSLGKHGYIPEARTDFILAVIVEELGMFGLFFILLFYGIILVSLLKNAAAIKMERDKMILVGVAAYLLVHFLFNVGGITALIPLTGVPLLLISSGASSKISFMIAIGIAQATIAKGEKGA